MSKVSRSKRIDRNRYAKTYPFIVRTPKYSYVNDPPVSYEIGEICFSNNDTVTLTFQTTYSSIPNILITAKGDDFNVWVEAVTASSAIIRASTNTNNCISYQIVTVGE